MVRSRIDETDVKLMKKLIFGPYRSKYELSKREKVPYVTVERRIPKLQGLGIITLVEKRRRKDGMKDKRKPERWALTLKGLVYLIVNEELSDKELEKPLQKLFDSVKYLKHLGSLVLHEKYKSLVIRTTKQSISQMQAKVNFEHFDKEYVTDLLGNLFIKNLFRNLRNLKSKSSDENVVALMQKTGTEKQVYQFFEENLKNFKSARKKIEDNIRLCQNAMKLLKH